jgi:hypothetical protein
MQLKIFYLILTIFVLASPRVCRASEFGEPADVCGAKSEKMAGFLSLQGVLITDGEHHAVLKSRNCPSYSLNYLMDVARVSENSPSFWNSFAPARSFAVGLRAYCIRVDGDIVGKGEDRYFLITKVSSFTKLEVDPAESLKITRVVCPADKRQ